jgi:hypothetical protein
LRNSSRQVEEITEDIITEFWRMIFWQMSLLCLSEKTNTVMNRGDENSSSKNNGSNKKTIFTGLEQKYIFKKLTPIYSKF